MLSEGQEWKFREVMNSSVQFLHTVPSEIWTIQRIQSEYNVWRGLKQEKRRNIA